MSEPLNFDSSDEEAEERVVTFSLQSPLQIDWLPLPSSESRSSTAIAISSLPGCRFRSTWRNLRDDLAQLREARIREVFVLCTPGELVKYRTPSLLASYEDAGISVHHWPIPDGMVPAVDDLLHLLQDMQLIFNTGSKVLIHCYGGLGRACLVATCLLLQLDDEMHPEQAIEKVRQLRGPGAIQTVKQYNFISDFRHLRDTYLQKDDVRFRRSLSR